MFLLLELGFFAFFTHFVTAVVSPRKERVRQRDHTSPFSNKFYAVKQL